VSLFETLRSRLSERNLDKRFPGAATVIERAATAHAEIGAAREAARTDKNLSPTGQHVKVMDHLEKAAPALRKHRRAVDMGRAEIERKRAGLRPKFDKTDPAILIAVAAKIAAMKPGDQAHQLLPEGADTDPIAAQAVLALPPILSGVNDQLRGALESRLIERKHGPVLAALNDEREAWDIAASAVRTVEAALQDAGEFPSPHAFNLWFDKAAPKAESPTADEKREFDALAAETILVAAKGLDHAARMKLHNDLLTQATDHIEAGGN
jgi:hypothetical protein